MKVRITKAEKETYWYFPHIGEEFEVIESKNGREYIIIRHPRWKGEALPKSDCEVITEQPINKKI